MTHKKKCVCGHMLNVQDVYEKGRAETLKEVMPILLAIVDEEGCYYGHQEEIEALEKEYLNNKKI